MGLLSWSPATVWLNCWTVQQGIIPLISPLFSSAKGDCNVTRHHMPYCILRHNFNHYCFCYKEKKCIQSSSNGNQPCQDNNDIPLKKKNKERHKNSQLKGAVPLSVTYSVSLFCAHDVLASTPHQARHT